MVIEQKDTVSFLDVDNVDFQNFNAEQTVASQHSNLDSSQRQYKSGGRVYY